MRQAITTWAQNSWSKRAAAIFVLSASTAIALPGQTFSLLYSFTNNEHPQAALVQATDGNLYGTTPGGGANNSGMIFKITPDGALTTVYSFCSQTGCADGGGPAAGLVPVGGDFYGTTSGGGAHQQGTFFKVTLQGKLTTLYSFCSVAKCADGEAPNALVLAASGDFYGTTTGGGASRAGTFFKVTRAGKLTTLNSFRSKALPGLVQAAGGNFYGTTEGQHTDFGSYIGTVFRLTPNGMLKTVHTFCSQPSCEDGYTPFSGLIQAADGNLYGTASQGGDSGIGTVFEMTPSGTLSTIHSFCDCGDGAYPYGGLIQATDGNFYGTTYTSANEAGTIYVLYPDGSASALYAFSCTTGCPDGANPQASLVQHTNGTFYGTTVKGGADYAGTVFSLSKGLGPFVKAQPAAGKTGAAVTILGTNLAGATSVTFNGTAAAFTVVTGSEITTTVPAGATTGTVQVATPGGTLLSNVPFRVMR